MENEKQQEITRRELPIKIALDKPINDGEKDLTEIVLKREPTGGDWGAFNVQNSTIFDFLRVASKISGVPFPVLKKIDTKATFEIIDALNSFLG